MCLSALEWLWGKILPIRHYQLVAMPFTEFDSARTTHGTRRGNPGAFYLSGSTVKFGLLSGLIVHLLRVDHTMILVSLAHLYHPKS